MKKFIVKKTDLFDGKNFYTEGSSFEADENDEDITALILSGNVVVDVEAELKSKADEDERLMKEAEEKEKLEAEEKAKANEENKNQEAPVKEEPVKEELKDQNQGRKKNRN